MSCRAYSLRARVACFSAKAVQYGAVGLVMGTLGSSLVLCLTTVRERLDREYEPPPTYQPVLGTGIGWLLFMSGSSNIRYNLINFLEDLAYDRCAFMTPDFVISTILTTVETLPLSENNVGTLLDTRGIHSAVLKTKHVNGDWVCAEITVI